MLADFNRHLKKAGKDPVTSISELNKFRSNIDPNIQSSEYYVQGNYEEWHKEIDRENGDKLILTNNFKEYKNNQEQKKPN